MKRISFRWTCLCLLLGLLILSSCRPADPILPPVTTDPSETSEALSREPEVTEPETTLPETEEPVTTEPETTEPVITKPETSVPATTAPATQPPATTSPATQPPATTAPATKPPATTAPATKPPATTAPATKPPATTAPATKPPATTAPATKPPATTAPATKPPATQPPVTTAPTTQPPVTTAPETTVPATTARDPSEPRMKTEATYSYRLISSTKQYHFYLITSTYSGEDHSFMIRVPIVEAYEYEPEEAAARMKPQIDTLNAMAASPANVNLWVYVATCLEDSTLMSDIILSEDLSSNYPYFVSQLNESIWCGHLEPFDIAERNDWYFATDHHWNSLGWYQAYLQLAGALAAKYPDITVREGSRVETSYYYYGSIGRDNGKLGAPTDLFAFYEFNLPEHETKILKVNSKKKPDPSGKTLYASAVPFEENISKYKSGKATTKMAGGVDTYDHYVNFYPICQEVVYPGNRTGRNLLFLGDSFSLCAQELMASYFDHSYFFYVDGTKDTFTGQEFTQYCLDHQITDVIFLEQSTRILYDFYDYSGPAMASFYVAD